MSGTTIIGALLLDHAPLGAVVAAVAIREDRLPDGIALPALLVREISSVEWQALTPGAAVPTTDRVAVAVRAGSSRERKAIMKLVRAACRGKIGTIAGFANVAVLTAGAGPAVTGLADSFEQTQDFRVAFDAPA